MAGPGISVRDAAGTPPAPAEENGRIVPLQQTPPTGIRRHLPFASMKPPFSLPDDYHHFSTPARAAASNDSAADQLPDAVVVKSIVGPPFPWLIFFVLNLSVMLFVKFFFLNLDFDRAINYINSCI